MVVCVCVCVSACIYVCVLCVRARVHVLGYASVWYWWKSTNLVQEDGVVARRRDVGEGDLGYRSIGLEGHGVLCAACDDVMGSRRHPIRAQDVGDSSQRRKIRRDQIQPPLR